MSFRSLEWGKYALQHADFTCREIRGTSIILTGGSIDNDGGGSAAGAYFTLMDETTGEYRWALIEIAMANLRANLGQSPNILDAQMYLYRNDWNSFTANWDLEAFRMLKVPDYTDATGRKRDATGSVYWTHDAYAPAPGDDHRSTAFWSDSVTITYGDAPVAGSPNLTIDLTDELAYALRSGSNFHWMLRRTIQNEGNPTNNIYAGFCWDTAGFYPYMEVLFLNPVEFFGASSGVIDLEQILIASDDLDDILNLGAVQRSETSTAVKVYVKNLSERTFDLVEIWDDSPEQSLVTHSAGSGTGSLDYVVLQEAAVSQKYTVNFYSTTEYEVEAEGYRDYTTDLHAPAAVPNSWCGTTGTDFTAPSGGLEIPAIAWQADGLTAADSFEVLVLGNTTDTGWAGDSNDQVFITHDNAGTADASGWRPVVGRRILTTASVTVDATTKKFPCRAITASQWVADTPAFIGDGTNLHEGLVSSAAEATIGTDAFTGVGLDDLTLSGNFNGTWIDTLRVEIDGTGTPDTFRWSIDGGSTWEASTVAITGSAQLLQDGIYVTFGATTGHTSGDLWDADVNSFYVELKSLTNDSTVYAAASRVGTTLPITSLGPSVWGVTNAASGVSEGQPQRIYMDDPVTMGFTAGNVVTIVDIDGATKETRTIAGGGVTSSYLELTANLTSDYSIGAMVTEKGSGEEPFWLRVTATATTDEEIKRLRLNVRT